MVYHLRYHDNPSIHGHVRGIHSVVLHVISHVHARPNDYDNDLPDDPDLLHRDDLDLFHFDDLDLLLFHVERPKIPRRNARFSS